jgi:hypothetical protein
MNQETTSKDEFFARLARISDEMIAAYDKDFAMGALVLAARFIAEGEKRANNAAAETGNSTSLPH